MSTKCDCDTIELVLNRMMRRKLGIKDNRNTYVQTLHRDDCPLNAAKGTGVAGHYAPRMLKGKSWRK